VINRIQCHVLLHCLDALKSGGGKPDFPAEFLECLLATFAPHEFGELFPQPVSHIGRVRQLLSHMWDKLALPRRATLYGGLSQAWRPSNPHIVEIFQSFVGQSRAKATLEAAVLRAISSCEHHVQLQGMP
jgi:hypothetical protein